jgi:uncharacterized caspase-like protein
MKNFLWIVTSLLLLTVFNVSLVFAQGAPVAANRPVRDKWAVVIGIDRFKDKRIPQLQYASKDARDFADFLIREGNFARDHILLLTNEQATENNIKRVVGDDWLPRRVLDDDVVLIFASTHGSPKELDVAGENFLITHDTDVDHLFSTAIELQDLAATIKRRTRCDRIVVFLDACNSGAAEAGGGKGLTRSGNFELDSIAGEGLIVVSSSSAQERSWESKRYQNGVFTHNLIEALKTKGPQTKLTDAFSTLKDLVEQEVQFDRRTSQTPVMKQRWNGNELALLGPATRPRKTEPYTAPELSGSSSASGTIVRSASENGTASSASATTSSSARTTPSAGPTVVAAATTTQSSSSSSPFAMTPSSQPGSNSGTTLSSLTIPGSNTASNTSTNTTSSTVTSTASSATATINNNLIGIIPFGSVRENIYAAPSAGVLWGAVDSKEELYDLPLKFGDCMAAQLQKNARLSGTVLQKDIGDRLRAGFPSLSQLSEFNLNGWKDTDFLKLSKTLGVQYVLTGVVEQIAWQTSFSTNKYTFVVSAKIIDMRTGATVASERHKELDSPWFGDKAGGRAGGKLHFVEKVLPAAAKELCSSLAKQLKQHQ